MKKIIIIYLLGFASLQCFAPSPTITPFIKYPPRPDNYEIKIYSVKLPDQPFEEIGLIGINTSDSTNSDYIMDILKQKAREMGGDAIIKLKRSDKDTQNHYYKDADSNRSTITIDLSSQKYTLSGIVVRFEGHQDVKIEEKKEIEIDEMNFNTGKPDSVKEEEAFNKKLKKAKGE